MACTGTVLSVITRGFSHSVLWPTLQVHELVEAALVSPSRGSWNFRVITYLKNMVKFYCNIFYGCMVVCIQIMVYRYTVVFLSSYFPCTGTISLGQVLSLLPQPHCQPVATCLLACHFHTLKMEAQCFREVLVSTDKTVCHSNTKDHNLNTRMC